MKIGYFSTGFPYINPENGQWTKPYSGGGVGMVALNLATQMANRGHDIYVFTSSLDNKSCTEHYDRLEVYRYPKHLVIGQTPISLDLLYRPYLTKVKLDLVHAHLGSLPAPLVGQWCARKMSCPFIVSYHGDWLNGYGDFIRRAGVALHQVFIADRILSKADLIIALSEQHINESKYLSKYRSKVNVIPNGVNLNEFQPHLSKDECRTELSLPKDKKIVLFVGSLVPAKALHVLIRAMSIVIREVNDAYLVLVGDGVEKDNLLNLVHSLHLEHYVKFTGFVGGEKKSIYYNSADVFVLPSITEAFPIVLLEASASGLPLIVSNLESLKAIVVDGYNGLITKIESETELAEKIIFLLTDKDARHKMGMNAQESIQRLTWAKVAEATENAYQKLLQDHL